MIGAIAQYLPPMLKGIGVTVQLTLFSSVLALTVAFLLGLCRLSRYSLVRGISYTFVEIIRGTSLLVQLFWFYYVMPFFGVEFSAMTTGVLAIGLNYGAYGSEIVRSSILAVPKGQTEAAIALNLTRWQRMIHVIIPQALMRMVPPFGNLLIELLKGTSLVYFITLADLTYISMTLRNTNYADSLIIFTLLLLIYFLIAQLMTLGVRWVEKRVTAGRLA